MPILQVVEFEGSRFNGKYFAGIAGLDEGRAGPVLVNDIAKAAIMSEAECSQAAETWAAWHTFRVVDPAEKAAGWDDGW